MPNHFHLVLWPRHDGDISRWVHWLLTTNVRGYQKHYHSSGHVWQGRSNPSRSRRTIISEWCCGTSNATRCGPAWWSARKTGVVQPARVVDRLFGPDPVGPGTGAWGAGRWRTSTPRCLTMMLPEYANPSDETARWAIPPGRWRLPGPWAWNPASAHPAARPRSPVESPRPSRTECGGGSPMRKDRAIQDPEARLPIAPIAPQKLPVSPFDSPVSPFDSSFDSFDSPIAPIAPQKLPVSPFDSSMDRGEEQAHRTPREGPEGS